MLEGTQQHTAFESAMLHMINSQPSEKKTTAETSERESGAAAQTQVDELENLPGASVADKLQKLGNAQNAIVSSLKSLLANMSQGQRTSFRQQVKDDPAKFLAVFVAVNSSVGQHSPSAEEGNPATKLVRMLLLASAVNANEGLPQLARQLRIPRLIDQASQGLSFEPEVSEDALAKAFMEEFGMEA